MTKVPDVSEGIFPELFEHGKFENAQIFEIFKGSLLDESGSQVIAMTRGLFRLVSSPFPMYFSVRI